MPTISSILEQAEKFTKLYLELENEIYKSGRKPGASSKQLSQLQKAYNHKIPDSVLEFYTITNGYNSISILADIFDIDSILSNNDNYIFDDFEDTINNFQDHEWGKNITKADIENLEEKDYLIIGQDDQNGIFINFKKPLAGGEYQVVSFSYKYVEAWNSFPDFLISRITSNEGMLKWKKNEIQSLKKDWNPLLRAKKEEKITKLFSKKMQNRLVPIKPIPSFKWHHKSTDIENANELIGYESGKKELVRIMYGLFFYMPYSPIADEIKAVYKIYRKYIHWNQTVHIRNTEPYTQLKKDTHANDWEFIETLFQQNATKNNWGLRTVDVVKGKSKDNIDNCEHYFNFRSSPNGNKDRPAFLAIHLKLDQDPKLLLEMAKEIIHVIPFISGHAGYDTFQSRINYKPTIEIEYDWTKRYAGIRIEEEEYLTCLWDNIWPANWLTIIGKPIISACKTNSFNWELPLKKEKDILIHKSEFGVIIQAGKTPIIGDVYKGQWPKLYSFIQAAINPLTLHPTKKEDITFGGKFDEENSSSAWFDRLINPENFYCLGEKEAIWLPVQLAKKKAKITEIEAAIDALKNYNGKGNRNNIEIYTAAYKLDKDFKLTGLSIKIYLQAINWPNTFISCYNNLLVHYLKLNNLNDAIKYLPQCIKAANKVLKKGSKDEIIRAGGVFWNAACIMARANKPDKAITYIIKAKEYSNENLKKMHRDEDFKSLWNIKEFEALF